MHQCRPARIVEIEGRAAVLAEMPLGRADAARIACRPARMIDAHVLLALHLQGCGLAGKVDGVAAAARRLATDRAVARSEEHTSELQSLMRISYAVFCLKKKKIN